jgi:6-phospho-beta-glucosidase
LKVNGRDYLPDFIAMLAAGQRLPGLPFSSALLQELQMIPNEYLYYFYSRVSAVENIISSGKTRGETILASNQELFAKLQELVIAEELDQIKLTYTQYLQDRGKTYMSIETGATEMDQGELSPEMISAMAQGGYVGVAMDVMEALNGSKPGVLLLNTPNLGAVQGFEPNDVLEIPAYVMPGTVQPLAVGKIPDHCIGLMKQVKKYEYLTIESAMDNSYQKALHALTVHPLVEDEAISVQILNDYIQAHGNLFPTLH